MFGNFFLQEEYANWLRIEKTKRQRAADKNETVCTRCGFCCLCRTCVPQSEELKSIADYLGISIKKMIEEYMVGDCMGSTLFLRWANTEQLDITGTFLKDENTFDKGQCIFYDEEKKECKIYSVRPADAKREKCWEDQNEEEIHRSINSWGTTKLKDIAFSIWDEAQFYI